MFSWFQRLLPKTGDFFGMFEAHAGDPGRGRRGAVAAGAGRQLDRRATEDHHEREHDADEIIREVLTTVRRTFLTPFDRGAITSLIASMDDAIDEMQAAAPAIDLYELRQLQARDEGHGGDRRSNRPR